MPSPYIKSTLVISLKTYTKNSWLPRVKSARSQSVLGLKPKATNPVTRLNSSAAALEKTTSNPNPIQIPNRNPCYHVEFIHSSFGRE